MCGRFSMSQETDELINEFIADGGDFRNWRPSWNVSPTQTIPVVIHSAKGEAEAEAVRRLEPARWSLTPSWSKELKTKFPTFAARAENITEKTTWKNPVKTHRALVPATGYYEWHTDPETKKKTPFYIHAPGDELLQIHDRNPIPLPRDWWNDWLDPEIIGDQAFVDAAV